MLITMMYHFVHSAHDNPIFHGLKGVNSEVFSGQIEFLLKYFQPITHLDLKSYFLEKVPLPKKAFYLTFDDGLRQHVDNVLPILNKYGLTGSFFVPTKPLIEDKLHFLEKQRLCQYSRQRRYSDFLESFWEGVNLCIPSERHAALEPNKLNIGNAKNYLRQFEFYSDEERFYRKVRDTLLNQREREDIIESMFVSAFDESKIIKEYYMTAEDLRRLSHENMIIGGHTHSHPKLEQLDDVDAEEEILRGMNHLSDITSQTIESISYPYGTYSEATLNIVQRLGVSYGYTTMDQVEIQPLQRFAIKRLDAASFERLKGYV